MTSAGLLIFAPVRIAKAQTCDAPTDLVAKWSGNGNPNDSVGGFDGTLQGDATFANGLVGQAFSIDGLGDYVELPETSAFHDATGGFTWGAWINADVINGAMMVFAEGDYLGCEDIYMGIGTPISDLVVPPPGLNDNVFGAVDPRGGCGGSGSEVRNQFSTDIPGLTPGTWHHLAMTADYNAAVPEARLYVDGVEVRSDPLTTPRITRSLFASIGAFNDGNQAVGFYPFAGLIDEVEVYHRALTDTEIADIFDCNNPNDAPTAVAGDDQNIRPGDIVFLDGSGSFDDNTASVDLVYAWTLTLATGSAATLDNAAIAKPSFEADVPGIYTAVLVVTDAGDLSSVPDQVTISSANLAPTAAAGDDQLIQVGRVAGLDGSGSMDPESDQLTFAWSITDAPGGSGAMIANADIAVASLTPDLAGTYEVTLASGQRFHRTGVS